MSDIDFEMLRNAAIELTRAKQFRYAAEVDAAAQRIRELGAELAEACKTNSDLIEKYMLLLNEHLNAGGAPPTQEQEG